jgi:hypothetical protein
MFKLWTGLAAVILSIFSLAAVASAGGKCTTTAVDASTATYFAVGDTGISSISFEPDALGSETVATITLQMCSREASTACLPYNYDSDADGLGDTNILSGLSVEKSGVKNITGFNFLLISVGTAPSGTDDPEYTICY